MFIQVPVQGKPSTILGKAWQRKQLRSRSSPLSALQCAEPEQRKDQKQGRTGPSRPAPNILHSSTGPTSRWVHSLPAHELVGHISESSCNMLSAFSSQRSCPYDRRHSSIAYLFIYSYTGPYYVTMAVLEFAL